MLGFTPTISIFLALVATNTVTANEEIEGLGSDDIQTKNLRSRTLTGIGGCGNNQKCVELWEPGSRYQAYSDGFCAEFNQCSSQYATQCVCRPNNYNPPEKNYIFEKSSDYSSISAYYPYNLPGFSIGTFVGGPETRVYHIVNGTADDAAHLADYAFSLQDEYLRGEVTLVNDVPLANGFSVIFTDLLFGFRVLRTGTYIVKAEFENDVYVRNGFSIEIRDRDYHPDRTTDRVFDGHFHPRSTDLSALASLEADHNYLLEIFGYISGLKGQTTLVWTVSFQD